MIGATRVVNAGSVGCRLGNQEPVALLGPDVQLRHTPYDLTKAAERIRVRIILKRSDFATQNVLKPPSEAEMLEVFTPALSCGRSAFYAAVSRIGASSVIIRVCSYGRYILAICRPDSPTVPSYERSAGTTAILVSTV